MVCIARLFWGGGGGDYMYEEKKRRARELGLGLWEVGMVILIMEFM